MQYGSKQKSGSMGDKGNAARTPGSNKAGAGNIKGGAKKMPNAVSGAKKQKSGSTGG